MAAGRMGARGLPGPPGDIGGLITCNSTSPCPTLRSTSDSCGFKTINRAVELDHLGCLIHYHENGCPLDVRSVTLAVKLGRLTCLRFMLENGWPVREIMIQKLDHISPECLQLLNQNGYLTQLMMTKRPSPDNDAV